MKKYSWLNPLILFNIVLILIRIIYTGKLLFAFLVWNLFLAAVPLYFSVKCTKAGSRAGVLTYACLWLLFFPNSMYIITDLFHLTERAEIPLWYDLLLLFSSATTGVLLRMLSLRNIEKQLPEKVNGRVKNLLVFIVMVLCGYGIYLGRFDRWNSWDVVTQPYYLIKSIAYHIIHPIRNSNVWTLSMFFGVWLYLLYHYSKKLRFR